MIESVDAAPEQGTDSSLTPTLGRLHLEAERSATRRAVLRWRGDARWEQMPAWRFYRQVIRVALFLRERLGVRPGQRVLVASRLRRERVIAEWAAVTVGGVAVTVDAASADEGVVSLCAELAPSVVFVASPEDVARLRGARGAPAAASMIVLDGAPPEDPAQTGTSAAAAARAWPEVVDLGGTLDTAERAQGFRAQARAWTPDMPAVGYRERTNGAGITFLTHGEVVRRIRRFWSCVPPGDADLAYVAARERDSSFCLPLWAFVADGRTSVALGTAGHEPGEIQELGPQIVVGVPGAEERRGAPPPGGAPARTRAARELGRLPLMGPLLRRWMGPTREVKRTPPLREVLTFDGTPVRHEKETLP